MIMRIKAAQKINISHRIYQILSLLFVIHISSTTTLQACPLPKDKFLALCENNDPDSLKKILNTMEEKDRLEWAQGKHGYLPLATYFREFIYTDRREREVHSISVDILAVLIDSGCNPDTEVGIIYGRFSTPLILAVYLGFDEIAQCLLQHGAKVDPYATTPLTLKNGIPGIENALGWRALHFAVHLGHTEMVRMLLAFGANPLATSPAGMKDIITPYCLAIVYGWRAIVQVFLEHGVPPETRYPGDDSPIAYCALTRNGPQIVELLLSTGNAALVSAYRQELIDAHDPVTNHEDHMLALFLVQEGFTHLGYFCTDGERMDLITIWHKFMENPIHKALHCGCNHLRTRSCICLRSETDSDSDSDSEYDGPEEISGPLKKASSMPTINPPLPMFETLSSDHIRVSDGYILEPFTVSFARYEYMPRRFTTTREVDNFLKVLNENKEVINDARVDGCSPLHMAVIYNNCPAVSALLISNADLSPFDCRNHTPLQTAYFSQNRELLDILVPAIRSIAEELRKKGERIVDWDDINADSVYDLARDGYRTEYKDYEMALRWPEVFSLRALAANAVRGLLRSYSILSGYPCMRLPIPWFIYKFLFGIVPGDEMAEK